MVSIIKDKDYKYFFTYFVYFLLKLVKKRREASILRSFGLDFNELSS